MNKQVLSDKNSNTSRVNLLHNPKQLMNCRHRTQEFRNSSFGPQEHGPFGTLNKPFSLHSCRSLIFPRFWLHFTSFSLLSVTNFYMCQKFDHLHTMTGDECILYKYNPYINLHVKPFTYMNPLTVTLVLFLTKTA